MMNLIPLLLVVDWISGIANVALRSRATTTTSLIWKRTDDKTHWVECHL